MCLKLWRIFYIFFYCAKLYCSVHRRAFFSNTFSLLFSPFLRIDFEYSLCISTKFFSLWSTMLSAPCEKASWMKVSTRTFWWNLGICGSRSWTPAKPSTRRWDVNLRGEFSWVINKFLNSGFGRFLLHGIRLYKSSRSEEPLIPSPPKI